HIKKNGYTHSQFHAVFSDHQLRVQKHRCSHPACRWQSFPIIASVFGTHIHPDLAKLQCEHGALYSYRESQRNLEQWNGHHRVVNNHTQVKRITDKGSVTDSCPIAPCRECAHSSRPIASNVLSRRHRINHIDFSNL